MTDHGAPDHDCTWADCQIDWLFDPSGLVDPPWRARVRSEYKAALSLVGKTPRAGGRWAINYDCCRICGSTETRHCGNGRCARCNEHLRRTGAERSPALYERKRAS